MAKAAGTRFRPDGGPLFGAAITIVLLLPLVLAWWPGGGTLPGTEDIHARIAWAALGRSVIVATVAAALAVMLGSAIAAALVLTDLPFRGLWTTALAVPFLCPRAVWALGQVYCYGPGGLAERCLGAPWRSVSVLSDAGHYLATALVLAEIHAPLAMLIVAPGLQKLQHAGYDSARLLLAPWPLTRWLAGSVRQEAAAAFLFALAMALGEFAVPHVLQCRLYPIEVYGQVINYLDEAGALRLALPLLTITLLAAAGVALAESGRKYVVAVPSPPRAPVRLGRYAWTIGGLLAAYLFFTSLLPLAAMLYECRSIAYFVSAARASAQELQNTLWLGSFAALVACAAGLAVGARTSGRWRLLADILALLPLGVPPLVVGLAYLHTCHRDWPLEAALLSDTNALAVLALAVRGWPFVTRMVAAGHRRIAPEWLDAAGLAGMGRWKRWWWISRPLVSDYLAGGALVAYVFAVGDVEITQMLCAPGAGSLAVRMCTFLHFGPSHVTASLAVLNLMIALLPVLLYVLITNRSVPVR